MKGDRQAGSVWKEAVRQTRREIYERVVAAAGRRPSAIAGRGKKFTLQFVCSNQFSGYIQL